MAFVRKRILLPVICFLMTACATTQRTDLFFGMNIPGGGHVSQEQWKSFTDSVISPRFPEGYTEWDALGKWQDTDTKRTISENTRAVTFIGKNNKSRDAALNAVIQAYIQKYRQQAVLRLDSKPHVQFISGK